MPVGVEINANHFRAVSKGMVTVEATPIYPSRTMSVWEINITNDRGKLVRTSRCSVLMRKVRPIPQGKMHKFVRSLITEWRRLRLPFSGEGIVIAVSGGADSASLLLALIDLKKRRNSISAFSRHISITICGLTAERTRRL